MKIKEVIFESIYRKISDDFVIIERTLKKNVQTHTMRTKTAK